jgi:hypothetical protein
LFVGLLAGLFVFQIVASAQLEEAERLIYLAKAIKRIVVKQIDKGQEGAEKSFEVKAYDKDGKEVNVSSDQANKLYKWVTKNSSGTPVDQKGSIESITDRARKVKNVLKLITDNAQKAAKLEVRLADQFSTYSSAIGKSSIAMGGKGGIGVFKSIGEWIGSHPYVAAAGGATVAGGTLVVANNHGGNDGGGGSTTTTTTTTTTGGSSGGGTSTSGSGDVSGTWHIAMYEYGSAPYNSFSMTIIQNGSQITGTTSDGQTISGSISGNSISFVWGDTGYGFNGTVSGGSMSGSYAHLVWGASYYGTFTGSK